MTSSLRGVRPQRTAGRGEPDTFPLSTLRSSPFGVPCLKAVGEPVL